MTPAPDRPDRAPIVVRLVASLAAGWLLYAASCWLVPPIETVSGFGNDWQAMSRDPFAFPGRLSHRILAPLLSWLLGYGGAGWLEFVGLLHVFMLSSVCFVTLHLGARLIDALLMTAAVAVTAPVQMYKLHWSGYADPICFGLFLWSMVAARKPYVFWSLFLVNLFNHELAGFMVPWLWFLRRRADDRWRLDLVLFGSACGLYLAYYLVVRAQAQQQFTLDYFVGHPLFPGGSFIVWNLAIIHVVCSFGPILAVLAWHQHGPQAGRERWHLWLVALGVFVIFCIAFDWARHSNLVLLPLVVAGARVLTGGWPARVVFAGLIATSLILFHVVPPWSSSSWPTDIFLNGPVAWRQAHPEVGPPVGFLREYGVVIIQEGRPGEINVSYGSLGTVLQHWLPVVWRPLLIVHGIGVAIWLLGLALARLLRPRNLDTPGRDASLTASDGGAKIAP